MQLPLLVKLSPAIDHFGAVEMLDARKCSTEANARRKKMLGGRENATDGTLNLIGDDGPLAERQLRLPAAIETSSY